MEVFSMGRDSTRERDTARTRSDRRGETARLLDEVSRIDCHDRRSELLDQVVGLNLEVASDIARRYHGRGIPDEDLDQVANLGLVKAV